MAIFPQLNVLWSKLAVPIALKKITQSVNELGSPVNSVTSWDTVGLVDNVSVEDEQFFQGLLSSDSRKVYLRASELASNGSLTQPISDLGVSMNDRVQVGGVEYSIIALRDYVLMNGFYVLLVKAVSTGG